MAGSTTAEVIGIWRKWVWTRMTEAPALSHCVQSVHDNKAEIIPEIITAFES